MRRPIAISLLCISVFATACGEPASEPAIVEAELATRDADPATVTGLVSDLASMQWERRELPEEWGACPPGVWVDFDQSPFIAMMGAGVEWVELDGDLIGELETEDVTENLLIGRHQVEHRAGPEGQASIVVASDMLPVMKESAEQGASFLVADAGSRGSRALVAVFGDGAFAFLGPCLSNATLQLQQFFRVQRIEDPAQYIRSALTPGSKVLADFEAWIDSLHRGFQRATR